MASLPIIPTLRTNGFAGLDRSASFRHMPSFSTTPVSTLKKSINGSYAHLSDSDIVMEVSSRGLTFLYHIGRRSPALPAPFKWLAPFERKDLIIGLKRDDYARHPYLQFTNKDLCKFIKDRGLSFPPLRNKPSLMAVLEEADVNFTFPITDLPPELRVKIYEYIMADGKLPPIRLPKMYKPRYEERLQLAATPHSRKQHKKPVPALTRVSRLIRQESLYTFEHLEKGLKDHRQKVIEST